MTLEEWGPWVLSTTSLPGIFLLRRKRRAGWLCSVWANGAYGAYNTATHQWGFVPLNTLFLLLSLSNYQAWGRDDARDGNET